MNCHQNTETADLIGGLRPISNRVTMEAGVMRGVLFPRVREVGRVDGVKTLLPALHTIFRRKDENLQMELQNTHSKVVCLSRLVQ